MTKSTRNPKGQFKNGTSGNPAGRPAGSRNKATVLCEQLLEGEAEELIRTLVEKAKGGNIQALGMCIDRLLPAGKERCINLESRPISSLQDLPIQFQDLASGIAEGRITPGEGESMANFFETHARIMERVDLDRRIAELEDQVPEMKRYRSEVERLAQDRMNQPEKPEGEAQ